MQILNIHIQNYRNLDDLSLRFYPGTNFIIGENNVGKSNFLDLLNILFNKNSFEEKDLGHQNNQIDELSILGTFVNDVENLSK